jgi:hypothetical protein
LLFRSKTYLAKAHLESERGLGVARLLNDASDGL